MVTRGNRERDKSAGNSIIERFEVKHFLTRPVRFPKRDGSNFHRKGAPIAEHLFYCSLSHRSCSLSDYYPISLINFFVSSDVNKNGFFGFVIGEIENYAKIVIERETPHIL